MKEKIRFCSHVWAMAFAFFMVLSAGCGTADQNAVAVGRSFSPNTAQSVTGGDGTTTISMETSRGLLAQGNTIVDENGQPVSLRGTNIGGWLVFENWMCGITDANDSVGRFAINTLEGRFGTTQAASLIETWQDNFIKAADFDLLRNANFNLLRIPFHWRNFQDAQGNWKLDAQGKIDFSRLDWAVEQASQRQMYVMPVFHIWDSQQVDYGRISGTSAAGAEDRQRAARLWTAIASHYLNNTTIAGFDIINEPTGSPGNVLQNTLYKAVRAADPNRMIVMESVGSNPNTYGWSNVVYSFHEYNMKTARYADNQNAWLADNQKLQTWSNLSVPVYVGEFMAGQSDANPTLSFLLKQMNQNGYAWTSWTYKGVNVVDWAMYNYPKSSRVNLQTDSFDQIQSMWKNMGTAKPLTTLVSTLGAYSQAR